MCLFVLDTAILGRLYIGDQFILQVSTNGALYVIIGLPSVIWVGAVGIKQFEGNLDEILESFSEPWWVGVSKKELNSRWAIRSISHSAVAEENVRSQTGGPKALGLARVRTLRSILSVGQVWRGKRILASHWGSFVRRLTPLFPKSSLRTTSHTSPRAVTVKMTWEPKRMCPKAVPTHPQNHVVWSHTLECSVKSYVTMPSTKCSLELSVKRSWIGTTFSPVRVLGVQWSRALILVCEVALSSYTMVFVQIEVVINKSPIIYGCLLKSSPCTPNMNAPHRLGIPKTTDNYDHVILGPLEHNQGIV